MVYFEFGVRRPLWFELYNGNWHPSVVPEMKSMGLLEIFDEDGVPFICNAFGHAKNADLLRCS